MEIKDHMDKALRVVQLCLQEGIEKSWSKTVISSSLTQQEPYEEPFSISEIFAQINQLNHIHATFDISGSRRHGIVKDVKTTSPSVAEYMAWSSKDPYKAIRVSNSCCKYLPKKMHESFWYMLCSYRPFLMVELQRRGYSISVSQELLCLGNFDFEALHNDSYTGYNDRVVKSTSAEAYLNQNLPNHRLNCLHLFKTLKKPCYKWCLEIDNSVEYRRSDEYLLMDLYEKATSQGIIKIQY